MYQDYKDVAEFRMIYIKEAHAADGRRPVGYAKELGITEHDNYKERCTTAEMLFKNKELTIPCLVDSMDDKTNKDYSAYPDRIFLVRKDGKLAVAAARGPWGFSPALKETQAWLAEFKESGKEPELKDSKDDSSSKSNDSKATKRRKK